MGSRLQGSHGRDQLPVLTALVNTTLEPPFVHQLVPGWNDQLVGRVAVLGEEDGPLTLNKEVV